MNSAYECIQVQLKKIIIKLKLGYVEIIWAPHKLYDTYYSFVHLQFIKNVSAFTSCKINNLKKSCCQKSISYVQTIEGNIK